MPYLHIDIHVAQSSKQVEKPCGDVTGYVRKRNETVFIICDGLGSGITANINANLCLARIRQLVLGGVSLRKIFASVARTMEEAKAEDLPYSVFSIARITEAGFLTVLSYEMPEVLMVTSNHIEDLPRKEIVIDDIKGYESLARLKPYEGVILLSDGIVESGLGEKYLKGWGIDGVLKYANYSYGKSIKIGELPSLIHKKAVDISGKKYSDDATVVLLVSRPGRVLNIMTGPPGLKTEDRRVAEEFKEQDGLKVIAGGATAEIYARNVNLELKYEKVEPDSIEPPCSYIDGIELVTEGVVTLNQVLRLIEDHEFSDTESAVGRLCFFLRNADFVRFYVGRAGNSAHNNIVFRQQGLLPRFDVIRQLVETLEKMGKLAIVEKV